MQKLRDFFDANPAGYEAARPGYPPELFSEIWAYAQLPPAARVLEIGVGTGQASLPFLEAGCRLEAVELGPSLAEFSREKFAKWPNFSLLEGDFMQIGLPQKAYHLAFSASAFHWLPQGPAYQRLKCLLRKGACLALFWASWQVHPDEKPYARDLRNFCEREHILPNPQAPRMQERMERKTNALRRRGFKQVENQLYSRTRALSAQAYLALLRSSNHHQGLNVQQQILLEEKIKGLIGGLGGSLRILEHSELYLGRNGD